jgi:hypothetical protein
MLPRRQQSLHHNHQLRVAVPSSLRQISLFQVAAVPMETSAQLKLSLTYLAQQLAHPVLQLMQVGIHIHIK